MQERKTKRTKRFEEMLDTIPETKRFTVKDMVQIDTKFVERMSDQVNDPLTAINGFLYAQVKRGNLFRKGTGRDVVYSKLPFETTNALPVLNEEPAEEETDQLQRIENKLDQILEFINSCEMLQRKS